MTPRRYAAAGSEAEFQPGSRGRVLRNFLGITKMREMEEAETQALIAAQRAARTTLRAHSSIHARRHPSAAPDVARFDLSVGRKLSDREHWQGRPPVRARAADPRLMANFGKEALRRHTPCGDTAHWTVARSLAEVHAQLILIHPFRDGNERLARLVSVLMATQAGVNSLRLSALAGAGRRTYAQAIHAAMTRDYAPLESLFSSALEGPWRSAAGTSVCKMVNLTGLTNMPRVPTAESAMETIAAAEGRGPAT